MSKEVCSYCQREYGSISKSGKILTKTFDHIIPKIRTSTPRSKDRRGVMCKAKNNGLESKEIDNLLQCCIECNNSKGHKTLIQWKYSLISDHHIWLSNGIKHTIINSINVLLENKPEPIMMDIMIKNKQINIFKI